MVYVELPQEGSKIAQGGTWRVSVKSNRRWCLFQGVDQIGAVESVKAASDIVRTFLV